jgi:hypothetical protein
MTTVDKYNTRPLHQLPPGETANSRQKAHCGLPPQTWKTLRDSVNDKAGDTAPAKKQAAQDKQDVEEFRQGQAPRNAAKDAPSPAPIDLKKEAAKVKQDTFDKLNKQADDKFKQDTDKLPPKPRPDDKRPPGDERSAQQIIKDSPLASNLGDQDGIQQKLKDIVGDYTSDPDAAYRLVEVLEYIEKVDRSGKPAEPYQASGMKGEPALYSEPLNKIGDGMING